MIAIVDYGVGNLFSLRSSLAALGLKAEVSGEPEVLSAARRVILPGVGAFGDAMARLRDAGLAEVLRRLAGQGKPLLGICLGMQLLFQRSQEFGTHEGLGLVTGEVCPLGPDLPAGLGLKVPHMGWNPLIVLRPECPILANTRSGEAFYYVHSYYARHCGEAVAAQSEYGVQVPGVVWNGNVYGTQFHPEKSGDAGLNILRAFGEGNL